MRRLFIFVFIAFACLLIGSSSWSQNCCTADKGNINLQGQADLSDLSLLIAFLSFPESPVLLCPDAADLNSSQSIDLSDLSLFIAAISTGYPHMPACVYDAPYGNDMTMSSCGFTSEDGVMSSNSVCLRWYYDGYSTLFLTHQGAQLNCCLEYIALSYEFSGDTILVNEQEMFGPNGPCNCLCSYSVSTQLYNIPAGSYIVAIGYPGQPASSRPRVVVNLLAGPEGTTCW